jgi:hypothetical protein
LGGGFGGFFHRFGVAFRWWQGMKRRDEMLFLLDFGGDLPRWNFL